MDSRTREPITLQPCRMSHNLEVPIPLFQNHQPRQPSIHDEYGYTHDQDPVQSQPEESVGDTQMFHSFPNLDDLTASDWSFLKGLYDSSASIFNLLRNCQYYIMCLSSWSCIMECITEHVVYVDQSSSIKFNIY
ncbi:replication enhancer protein [Cotton leaf curl Kokhran virus]|uniref:Replication enhancer protein n=1 Tax=Cotton leaf curl Kokhran virus TaxID=222464 RepID=D3Y1N3_9GEMI|nr:replication enhancer protein [Cotton leaf curl Kokhran virus]